jgi:two-component system nitrate/nitrite response regulator NarL
VPTSLVLADDHPFILDGLDLLFGGSEEFRILARCNDGEETVRAVSFYDPDILVLDIRMPRKDGVAVLKELNEASARTRTILLTASLDDARLLEAFRLGAKGLVLKEMAPRLLLQCVRAVAAGGECWDHVSVVGALQRIVQAEKAVSRVAGVLTARELEIARMVASGLRNKDIATKLAVTEATVKFHLHSIYEKLNIDGRFSLIAYARDHGLA